MPINKNIVVCKYLVLTGLMLLNVGCSTEKSESTVGNNATSIVESTPPKQEMDQATQQAVAQLQWVNQFDMKKQFDKAAKTKDFRLFVIAKRGPNVPGVELSQQAILKEKCGEKYLEGIGDIQYGDVHKKLYEKAVQLASEYNQKVIKLCESSAS